MPTMKRNEEIKFCEPFQKNIFFYFYWPPCYLRHLLGFTFEIVKWEHKYEMPERRVDGGRLILQFLSRISWNFTYQNVFIKITFTTQRKPRKIFHVICCRSLRPGIRRWSFYLFRKAPSCVWKKHIAVWMLPYFNNDWHGRREKKIRNKKCFAIFDLFQHVLCLCLLIVCLFHQKKSLKTSIKQLIFLFLPPPACQP